VELVVIRNADDTCLLRSNQRVERNAGRLEPIDHPNLVGVAMRISPVVIGREHAIVRKVLDAGNGVADEVRKLARHQARG
jgi:hypothetical protein